MRASLSLVLLLSACGGVPSVPDAGSQTFIALTRDFAGFRSWRHFDGANQDAAGHPMGANTLFINRDVPTGSDTFPVGTIIVREQYPSDGGTTPELHAMAKRGASFNTMGAHGWEWFELTETSEGVALIYWRGAEPPSGESYSNGIVVTSDCNGCHSMAVDNDSVMNATTRLHP